MYWDEDNQDSIAKIDNTIVDVSFKVNCQKIAADHSYHLFEAILKEFPNIEEIDNLAIHSVYGAESGAGWERPETEIYLSKRRVKCYYYGVKEPPSKSLVVGVRFCSSVLISLSCSCITLFCNSTISFNSCFASLVFILTCGFCISELLDTRCVKLLMCMLMVFRCSK